MTDRVDELHELYAFNRWANERILDAAATLSESELTRDLGSSFASVKATLVHIVGAEWVWISRWEGVSPRALPQGWSDAPLAELRRHLAGVQERQRTLLSAMGEADLERVVAYTNIAGEALESSVRQMLRHVVNHSTYHRGQVVTMLRQLGKPAPATDLIQFHRTVAAEA